eukprot:TRINITY_DN15485_c0_g1_i1.p1 TRINITY_DN15485_c0_g1~~TRINITY_DN15485_c0_g1_i1.p1  ORF type:complete len:449 (+),score=58.88 TRINITY_DN15485_c0_g1_i1:71-1348(+)
MKGALFSVLSAVSLATTAIMMMTVLLSAIPVAQGLNNGLALTPPMGWLSWERFRCNVDCVSYPDSCISEQLYMDMADELVEGGYADLGYVFVNVDDCWAEMERDNVTQQMVPNRQRFPNGIEGLANYVHSKGLKLGLYTDIGTNTCGGYPGSYGYYELDAQTFASWGIDSLKVDGCYADSSDYATLYPEFGAQLLATNRPIVYYCSWPAYIVGSANFTQIAEYCNGWRSYDDIQDSADSLYSIISWYGQNAVSQGINSASGPGAWNDADQLIIGDFGLSFSQMQLQMGLWAILASPMLMSNDLRRIDPSMVALLQNEEIIAISQDPLGVMGSMIADISSVNTNPYIQWWTRPLQGGDLAVLVTCWDSSAGTYFNVTQPLMNIGWPYYSAQVRDLFNQVDLPTVVDSLTLTVGPNYSSFVRLTTTA